MNDIAAFKRSLERATARRAKYNGANKPQQKTKMATPTITAKPVIPAPSVEVSIEERYRAAVLNCFYNYCINKRNLSNEQYQ